MIFVPDARTCMIWKEGSKWEHVASATRHGQVPHGGVMYSVIFWLLGASLFFITAHAAFYNYDALDVPEDQEQLVGAIVEEV